MSVFGFRLAAANWLTTPVSSIHPPTCCNLTYNTSELSPGQACRGDPILSPLHRSHAFSIPCLCQAPLCVDDLPCSLVPFLLFPQAGFYSLLKTQLNTPLRRPSLSPLPTFLSCLTFLLPSLIHLTNGVDCCVSGSWTVCHSCLSSSAWWSAWHTGASCQCWMEGRREKESEGGQKKRKKDEREKEKSQTVQWLLRRTLHCRTTLSWGWRGGE